MDIIVEILLEVYMELMMLIVPEKSEKKRKTIATILALIVLALVFALVIWGCILVFDYGNLYGIIPLSFAIIISIVQISFGIVRFNKNHQGDTYEDNP